MKRKCILFLVVCLCLTCFSIPANALVRILDVTSASFGAKGDGVTDDSASIKLAINSAQAGDVVYFPAGTYRIRQNLILKSGLKIRGASKQKSILQYDGNYCTILGENNITDVEISLLTLDGNNKSANAVILNRVRYANLHDLVIKNFNINGPAIHFVYTEDSVIQNCQILNTGVGTLYGQPLVPNAGQDWGAGVRLSTCQNIRVIGNTVENTGRGGILCDSGCKYITISGNTVAGSSINNPKIDGVGGEGLGIELHDDSEYCVVEDNLVDRWLSVVRSRFIAVRRNVVDLSLPPGVTNQGQDYYGIEMGTESSVYTGNYTYKHWEGLAINGIDPSHGLLANNYFANNTFDSPGQFGAEIFGTDGWNVGFVKNLYFYQNQFLNASRTFVTGMEGAGVSLRCNVQNLTFESCKFKNGRLGVLFQQDPGLDGLYFENCEFTGNTSNGGQGGLQMGGVMTLDYSPEDGKGFSAFEMVNTYASGNEDDRLPQMIPFRADKPAAGFTVDGIGGNTYQFTDTSFDSDGIETYLWDFGAGAPSGEKNPAFTYEKDGVYTVTLIVWDKAGRASRFSRQIVAGGAPDWEYAFREVTFEQNGVSCVKPESGDFTVRAVLSKQVDQTSPSYYVVAAYDNRGQLLDSSIAEFEQTGAAVLRAQLSVPDGQAVSKIRTFLWNAAGTLAPESKPMER